MATENDTRDIGRPTKYKPEYAEQALSITKLGAIDIELAEIFGVAESTINLWKKEHPEFSESIKLGKDLADSKVQRSLFKRATGYEYDSEKVFQYEGSIVRADITEHIPPDTAAAFIWLKNRKRADFKDRPDERDDERPPGYNQQININLVINKLTQNPFGARLIECSQQSTSQASEPQKLTSAG